MYVVGGLDVARVESVGAVLDKSVGVAEGVGVDGGGLWCIAPRVVCLILGLLM